MTMKILVPMISAMLFLSCATSSTVFQKKFASRIYVPCTKKMFELNGRSDDYKGNLCAIEIKKKLFGKDYKIYDIKNFKDAHDEFLTSGHKMWPIEIQ